MAISKLGPIQVLTAQATTTTVDLSTITGLGPPDNFHKHKALCEATGGTWVFVFQESPDDGSTWIDVTDELTLAAGETGTIRLNDAVADLRISATRTGGTCDVWATQHDDITMAPRG